MCLINNAVLTSIMQKQLFVAIAIPYNAPCLSLAMWESTSQQLLNLKAIGKSMELKASPLQDALSGLHPEIGARGGEVRLSKIEGGQAFYFSLGGGEGDAVVPPLFEQRGVGMGFVFGFQLHIKFQGGPGGANASLGGGGGGAPPPPPPPPPPKGCAWGERRPPLAPP